MKKLLFLVMLAMAISTNFLFASQKDNFLYNLPTDVCLVNSLDPFIDLPASSTATVLGVAISTQTLVANTTTYTLALGDITDVVFPRNIVCDMYFAAGESTTTATGTLTVTGYNQFGRLTSEALVVSSNSINGDVAWSKITQLSFSGVTISGSSESNVTLYVGMGTKIALSNNIGDSADILKVIETGITRLLIQ